MLEFFTIIVSTILSFFVIVSEAVGEFPRTAFSYGSVAEQTTPRVNNQSLTTNFIFTGDIMLARNVERLMKDYGPTYPFSEIESLTKAADFTVGNF